jgi:uncharacterized tellurite resistance protein B-like protein
MKSDVNVWHVLGGAVAGAALIATSPVSAPLAVGVGALVGAVIGPFTAAIGHAEPLMVVLQRNLATAFEATARDLKTNQDYYDLVVAMAAVGLACATADGDIHAKEAKHIDEFIDAVDHSKLPEETKEQLAAMRQNPPTLETAAQLVQDLGVSHLRLFDEIITMVTHADEFVHKDEINFAKKWRDLLKRGSQLAQS